MSFTPGTTTAADGEGYPWVYDYNERGQVTMMVAPDQRDAVAITYDPLTRGIASIAPCGGPPTQFEYSPRGNLTRVIDVEGNTTEMEYHPQFDVVTRLIEPDGREWHYQYDAAGNLTHEIDPLLELPVDRVLEYQYDATGLLTRSIDRNGNVITYGYSDRLLTTITVDPDGLNLVTTYEYDAMGRLTKIIDANGVETTQTVDAFNRVTDVTVDPGSPPHLNLHTQLSYDEHGNIETETDARGVVTRYEYDHRGRLVSEIQDFGGLNFTTTHAYDDCDRHVAETDPLGNTTTFVYDERGRLIEEIDAAEQSTEYTYDCQGNLVLVVDDDGRMTSYEYDALNRLVRETVDPNGLALATEYEYTSAACGCGTPGSHLIHKLTDPDGRITYTYYDELDREVAIVRKVGDTADNGGDSDDAVTLVEYDANGNVTEYTHDSAGRRISETYADGSVRSFTYDGDGNILTQTDANNNITTYTYDDLNRLVRRDYTVGLGSPSAPTPSEIFAYDRVGNLTSADNSAADLDFTYDAAGRVTELQQDAYTTAIEYGSVATGLYRQVTYPSLNWVREQRQIRNGLADITNNGTIAATFTFDTAGRITGRTYVAGSTTTSYGYTPDLYVTSITHSNAGDAFVNLEYGRDAEGNPTYLKKLHDPGNSELYTYDVAQRLTDFQRGTLNATNDGIVGFSGLPTLTQQQTWTDLDPLGNWRENSRRVADVVTTEERGVDQTNAYTNCGWAGQWHDNNGNLLLDGALGDTNFDGLIDYTDFVTFIGCNTQPCAPAACDPAAHGGAVCDLVDFEGDGDVDLNDYARLQWATLGLGDDLPGATRYTYDVQNRLVKMEHGGLTVAEFAYDALNRRVRQTTSAGPTTYLYDDQYRVLEERGGEGTLTARYVYGEWLDDAILMERDGNTYYYHRDAIGSVVAITNATGQLVEQYAYDPYGRALIRDGSGTVLSGSAIGNPYLFTGRRYDEATGLYYYRARHYDAERGRFLTRDPLGYAGGDSLYQYVSSRPTVNTDPTGLVQPGFEKCVKRSWRLGSGKKKGAIGPVTWKAF